MTMQAAEPGKLDINRVIQRTIEVLRARWRDLIAPAALYLFAPAAIVGALRPPGRPFEAIQLHPPLWSALGLLALIPYAIFKGGLIRLSLAELVAAPISTDAALATGRQRMWALLGLYILMALAVGLGIVLLIVPGVLVALAWCVAAPVLIEEGRPITACFRRSAELTRGTRLNILGVGLALVVFEVLVMLAVEILAMPFPRLVFQIVLRPLASSGLIVVGAVLVCAIYNELLGLAAERDAA